MTNGLAHHYQLREATVILRDIRNNLEFHFFFLFFWFNSCRQTELPKMGCKSCCILRHHIWGYIVCLYSTNMMQKELNDKLQQCDSNMHLQSILLSKRKTQVAQGQRSLTWESTSIVTGQSVFFFPYMGMTVILVKFQAYGCNGFHRIIGPVNAYPRPSCHFFPCFHVCLCFQNRPLSTLITYLHLLYQLFASITFQFLGCNSFQKITF